MVERIHGVRYELFRQHGVFAPDDLFQLVRESTSLHTYEYGRPLGVDVHVFLVEVLLC